MTYKIHENLKSMKITNHLVALHHYHSNMGLVYLDITIATDTNALPCLVVTMAKLELFEQKSIVRITLPTT